MKNKEKTLFFGCKTKHSQDYKSSFQPYQSITITKEKALFIRELLDVKFNHEAIAEICTKKWNLLWDLNEQDIRGEKRSSHIGRALCDTVVEILNDDKKNK